MTTQVIFKIDPRLKQKAQRKAKAEGLSYSQILESATRAYVEGDYRLRFLPKIKEFTPTKRDLRELAEARADFAADRYVSWDTLKNELDHKHKVKG